MSQFDAVFKYPGQLIAAVPALLGFVPERSMIVVLVGHGPDHRFQIRFAARLDLSPAAWHALARERLVCVVRNCDAVAALVVIVDDRTSQSAAASAPAGTGHRMLIEAFRRDLNGCGVELAGAWAVRSFGEAAEWWTIESPHSRGLVPDPLASPIAAAQAYAGRTLRSSRAALNDVVAIDEAMRDEVARYLPVAIADAQRRLVRAIQIDNPDAHTRMALCRVMAVITRARERDSIAAPTIAEVAVAMRDHTVRDIMFGVAGGVHEPAAEHLWAVLTRALPDPDRAEAATLLAFHAYRRGDGVLAGVALEQAFASDREHRMALLLDAALQSGLAPARLQRIVDSGIEAASDLRVDIGCGAAASGVEVVR